ncbi:hypothetical protein GE061_006877 [Apolygus lucorum]|uniref:Uncharacterized protein n=1 Tax=Apolygus lucorum TaxID=248454 RepID=A0A8S9WRK0_APOLU|nr:hypothetical protein GE061_006877 [Apolygus lucorum]
MHPQITSVGLLLGTSSELTPSPDTSVADIISGTPFSGIIPGTPINISMQVTSETPEEMVKDKLQELYQASYLNSPGLPGGLWYERWRIISQLRGRQYDLPGGSIGDRFVEALANEILSLAQGEHTSERAMVFAAVLLQRNRMIKHAKDIRILLERRLRLWSECEWDILINEAVTLDKKLMNRGYGNGNDISKIFHSQMARGKVKEAMRKLTEEVDTSVLDPMKIIDDAGTTVLDDLKSKHPLPTIPDPESLHLPSGFTEIPPLLQVQVTADIVEVVARKLHGGGGPSGSKADQWADFLLRHGRSSTHLREAVAALANRLGNEDVPWDSIRALVASRLVALDKCPWSPANRCWRMSETNLGKMYGRG